MNYGNYGRDLLLELKRSDNHAASSAAAPSLPAYNDTLVTAALDDLTLHVQALHNQVTASQLKKQQAKPSKEERPSMMLQAAAIQRNKRCLLTYHWVRLQRMQQQYYWRNDGEKSEGNSDPQKSSPLAPAEEEFLRDYRDLQRRYVQSCLGGGTTMVDDLRTHATHPPAATDRVVVRVNDGGGSMNDDNNNNGPVVLASGQTVDLGTPGATHCLLWSDVQDMVRTGVLQVLHEE